jgi:hypothetical protein
LTPAESRAAMSITRFPLNAAVNVMFYTRVRVLPLIRAEDPGALIVHWLLLTEPVPP